MCLVGEVRYNVNFETRDEDFVWIWKRGPYRHDIGRLVNFLAMGFWLTRKFVHTFRRQL